MRLIVRATQAIVLAIIPLTLAACGLVPGYYSGADGQETDKRVWENMRDLQTAAEHYAANHGGDKYPLAVDDAFKSYLPGGREDDKTPRPVGLINPFSGANEWPSLGGIKSITEVRRQSPPWLRPGEIQYTPVAGGRGYAIIGGAHDGHALRDWDGRTLVFTNFSEEELLEQESGRDRSRRR